MGIGVSLFLLAVGAILRYAVETSANGINLDVVGMILMIVGALGILLSLAFWSSLGFGRRAVTREVVRDEEPL